jgi:acyl-CoA thioester hydrolase
MSQPIIHHYDVTILEHHLDAYGHVNHVAYIGLFEQARWEMVHQAGCGLEYVHQTGVGPVVIEIKTKFRKELRLRQKVKIRSQMVQWHSKIGTIRQTIIDDQGVVYCDALITLGMFDMKLRKLVSADDKWAAAMGVEFKSDSPQSL